MIGLALQTVAAETVLRVAMTAGDVPLTIGQPDQGFEGYRFVGYNLYDTLILWDLSRADVVADLRPGLATSWEADPADPTRWILELRQGVKWHDGCDFTAADVVWNFDRIANDQAPQFHAKQFADIRNRTGNIKSIAALSDHKIVITTQQVDALLPYQLSYWFMISRCQLESLNYDYAAYQQHPSGTGPYKFAKLVPRERLELVKNPGYWDSKRIPHHDRLVLIPMPEATTRTAALLSEQVDFIEAPAPDTIPRLKSAGMQIVTNGYPHNWGYQLNFVDGPFKDLRVRKAANLALNRADMKALLGGYMIEGVSNVLPSTSYHGEPSFKITYDPKQATALLKEAKCYPCAITLAISTSGSGQMQPLPMNELVKAQLEAVGFKVKLDVMDWNALLDLARPGREKSPGTDGINISRALQDPFSALIRHVYTKQQAPKGSNWGHYSNAAVDALIDDIYATFDPPARLAKLTKLHEMMVDEAVMLWVAHDVNPRALHPRVKGFVQAQSWFQDLTPIRIAP
jgi:ABC-type transport system substrate-binding protein